MDERGTCVGPRLLLYCGRAPTAEPSDQRYGDHKKSLCIVLLLSALGARRFFVNTKRRWRPCRADMKEEDRCQQRRPIKSNQPRSIDRSIDRSIQKQAGADTGSFPFHPLIPVRLTEPGRDDRAVTPSAAAQASVYGSEAAQPSVFSSAHGTRLKARRSSVFFFLIVCLFVCFVLFVLFVWGIGVCPFAGGAHAILCIGGASGRNARLCIACSTLWRRLLAGQEGLVAGTDAGRVWCHSRPVWADGRAAQWLSPSPFTSHVPTLRSHPVACSSGPSWANRNVVLAAH